jgi:hypothetical protein
MGLGIVAAAAALLVGEHLRPGASGAGRAARSSNAGDAAGRPGAVAGAGDPAPSRERTRRPAHGSRDTSSRSKHSLNQARAGSKRQPP